MRDYQYVAQRLSMEADDTEDYYADEIGDAAMAARVLDTDSDLW
jgi:hypothetical protein